MNDKKYKAFLTLGLYGFLQYLKLQKLILNAAQPFFGMALGIPTDVALKSIYWPNMTESKNWNTPDITNNGILFSCPIVPMTDQCLNKALNIINEINNKFNVNQAVTLNMQHDKTLEGVISIDFDRTKAKDVINAQAATTEINHRFIEEGFIPYGININDINLVIKEEDEFWKTVSKIKKTLDPKGVIFPGRFAPLEVE